MSPRPELLALVTVIERHLGRIGDEVLTVERGIATADQGDPYYARAVGAGLQSFYTGIEVVLDLIVREFEGRPKGPDWHRQLLERAALEVPAVRPRILAAATALALDRYRSFRHLFRSAYGIPLEWDRMADKARKIRATFDLVKCDLEAFRDFLNAAAAE